MMPLEEIALLADVPIELDMELGRRVLPFREVLEWEPGSVVWLPRSAGENLDVRAGGVLLGSGEIVVIESTFGVRLTDFASVERA
jgi:flagellar motor switch protein FliN/FliY